MGQANGSDHTSFQSDSISPGLWHGGDRVHDSGRQLTAARCVMDGEVYRLLRNSIGDGSRRQLPGETGK